MANNSLVENVVYSYCTDNEKCFCVRVQDLLYMNISKKEMFIFPSTYLFKYFVLNVKVFFSFNKPNFRNTKMIHNSQDTDST